MRLRALTAIVASAAVAVSVMVGVPAAQAAEKPRPFLSGWFGWWASDTSITQMTSTADGVAGEVAMFWWSFQGKDNPLCLYDNGDYDKDGSYGDCIDGSWSTPWTTPKFDRQRKMLQAAGIKINASITDVGSAHAGQLSAYLDSAKNRRAYAKKIADYAVKAGVDGIDLDWEAFAFADGRDSWDATKPRWIAFIKELSTQLHAKDLTLWATVPGGVPPFSGTGAPNPGTGYWVYAWKEIAPFVDRLNIMAYDYSWSVPGPIGPNDWAGLVAKSAVQQIGEEYADRVFIGAPQYGRNWPVAVGSGWSVDADCPAGWKPTSRETPTKITVTPMSAREIAAREKVEPQWDERYGEWTFDYWMPTAGKVEKKSVSCKVKRRVWFADTRSALARASWVPDLRIGGIAVWDFGTVTSDFYSRLADYGRSISPKATSVTVTAPKSITVGRTASVKVATDSKNGAAKGAQATLYFQPVSGSRTKIESITLDNDGRGAFTVPAQETGDWIVAVEGSWSRAAGESAPVRTTVRYAVSLTADKTKVARGATVTLSGTVRPEVAGTSATVQRRSGSGAWRDVATVATTAGGAYTTTVKPTVAGDAAYRVVVAASATLAQGVSPRVTITVS